MPGDALSNRVRAVLACPNCGGCLGGESGSMRCAQCGQVYEARSGQVDLRLRRPKPRATRVLLGAGLKIPEGFSFGPLRPHPAPAVDFTGLPLPRHLSPALLSHFPRASAPGSLMLDLGCGTAMHRAACERAGFEYVGVDYNAATAPILAGAQALPFADASFEFVLSIAVLEHVQFPAVMLEEACRVLGRGGRFLGTVAFLEPFHGDSLYHHSHLGIYNGLQSAGFEIEMVAPDPGWTVLQAQAGLALFPSLPRAAANALVWPVELAHRWWWRAARLASGGAKGSEARRVLWTTGAHAFMARKP